MGRGKRKLEPRGLTLPVKLDGDALDRARQRIAHYNDMGGFRLDAGHGLTQNAMKQFANASASNLALVKHYARKGSTDAYAVLKTMAEEELGRDGRCRPQLADFLIDQLNGLVSRQRGPKKATNFLRDCIFVSVIAEIVYWFNLRPTRNRESRSPPKKPSACMIVAEAIRLELPAGANKANDRALEQVWTRVAPWYLAQAELRGRQVSTCPI